jgi:hypothetical protein
MGMLKRMKDLKDMTEAAPGMVQQARALGAQAQEYSAAQQAAMQAQQAQMQAAPAPAGADFDPIAGVSLELFADVSKGLAAYSYDITKAPEIAASKGVSPDNWNVAMNAWNDRIRANPAVAKRFNALYTGRA